MPVAEDDEPDAEDDKAEDPDVPDAEDADAEDAGVPEMALMEALD